MHTFMRFLKTKSEKSLIIRIWKKTVFLKFVFSQVILAKGFPIRVGRAKFISTVDWSSFNELKQFLQLQWQWVISIKYYVFLENYLLYNFDNTRDKKRNFTWKMSSNIWSKNVNSSTKISWTYLKWCICEDFIDGIYSLYDKV